MVGKRRSSTRVKPAGTPASKAQKQLRPEKSPSTNPGSSTEPLELPSRVQDGKALPTTHVPQPGTLSDLEYQSIAASDVLATSLRRSRDVWLADGIFDRYWAKPTRRKTGPASQNPPKESMVKLGPGTLSVGPHLFEVVFFGVKAPQPQGDLPPPQKSIAKPALQSRPPPKVSPVPTPVPVAAVYQHAPSTSHHSVAAATLVMAPKTTAPHPPHSAPAQSSSTSTSSAHRSPLPHDDQPGPTMKPNVTPGPDPVIQMLAARAATDPNLKELMRIVASGRANTDELKIFQSHIDELSATYQSSLSRQEERFGHGRPQGGATAGRSLAPASGESARPPGLVHHANAPTGEVSGRQAPSPSAASQEQGGRGPVAMKREHSNTHQSTRQPAKHGPRGDRIHGAGHAELTAVLLEFTAGAGDRYLFPKHSVLDFSPDGTQAIASFLVVRKGDRSEAEGFDPETEYHQPVTVLLSATTSRVLDPLARVVASPTDAAQHMNDIMAKTTRAPNSYLALRLPKGPESVNERPHGAKDSNEMEACRKGLFAPPGSLGPLYKDRSGVTVT